MNREIETKIIPPPNIIQLRNIIVNFAVGLALPVHDILEK